MRRLPSRLTFLTKWFWPAIGFGFLAWVLSDVLRGAFTGRAATQDVLFALMMITLFAGIEYFVFKRLVFDLADAVWDADTELVVKNKGQTERIALRDVNDVILELLQYPQRVTLKLRKPAFRKNQIVFMPPTFRIQSEAVLISELIQRVAAAREG